MNIRLGLTAEATGTGDAIEATFNPAATLEDRKVLFVTAIAANSITNPTFSPNGLTAYVITKLGGQALVAGDILGAGHVLLLQYNLAATRWELLNPSKLLTHSTLAQILLNDNKTGGTKLQSDNGYSQSKLNDTESSITHFNGANGGGITNNDTKTIVEHSALLELDAPNVRLKQGYLYSSQTAPYENSYLQLLDNASALLYYSGVVFSGVVNQITKHESLWFNGSSIYAYLRHEETKTTIVHPTLIELTSASVTKNGSEIATQSYVDGMVAGLLDDRGSFDASINLFPSTGGSGTAGAILKGDIWYISIAGTLGGTAVTAGDSVRALVDSPAQTAANWSVLETNIGYVPENVANKTDTVAGNTASSTKYLSVKGYYDYLVGFTWLTDSIFGTWINALTDKTTPVDADTLPISDSADSNKTKKLSFTNLKAFLLSYFNTQGLIQRIYSNITPFTSTTTATDEIAQIIPLTGGTLTANDFFDAYNWVSKTGTAGNKISKLWINTTNDLTGSPVEIARFENTSAAGSQLFFRTFAIKSNTTIRTLTTGTAQSPGFIAVATLGTDITIPTLANNIYLITTIQRTNGADTYVSEGLKIVPQKAA